MEIEADEKLFVKEWLVVFEDEEYEKDCVLVSRFELSDMLCDRRVNITQIVRCPEG